MSDESTEIPKGSYAAGRRLRLPPEAEAPYTVFINGIEQREGAAEMVAVLVAHHHEVHALDARAPQHRRDDAPAAVGLGAIATFCRNARKVGIAAGLGINKGLIEQCCRFHQGGDVRLRTGQGRQQRFFLGLRVNGIVGANHICNHGRCRGYLFVG